MKEARENGEYGFEISAKIYEIDVVGFHAIEDFETGLTRLTGFWSMPFEREQEHADKSACWAAKPTSVGWTGFSL